VIVLAIFGLHAGGWVDPISLATRTYTTTLYPLVTAAATGALGEGGSESTGGQVFACLQEHGLPTIVVAFDYWWLMLAVLGGLLTLDSWQALLVPQPLPTRRAAGAVFPRAARALQGRRALQRVRRMRARLQDGCN
jgi:hypothetical protein